MEITKIRTDINKIKTDLKIEKNEVKFGSSKRSTKFS